MSNETNVNDLTDEEVMNMAAELENPWVDRLMEIILQLETELAYTKEENMDLRVRYVRDSD